VPASPKGVPSESRQITQRSPGLDDLAAERLHPLDRGGEVGDREIGKREAVAWAGAALVQPGHDPCMLALPAAALLWSPVGERRLEQAPPELPRAFRLVGGKLDQLAGDELEDQRIRSSTGTPQQGVAPEGVGRAVPVAAS
jgi:hypothetical protein